MKGMRIEVFLDAINVSLSLYFESYWPMTGATVGRCVRVGVFILF